MRSGRWSVRTVALLLVPVLPLGSASCFSDRGPLQPADAADCAVPLDVVRRGDALVFIRQQQFVPDRVMARPGQFVTWINCEEAGADPHTSTAANGKWESPLLQAGAHFSTRLDERGSFAYSCLPHPHMRGTVGVN